MIPKVIHYCWFGRGEKNKLFYKCYKSWKKYCPDYTIIEWNEDNLNLNECQYCRDAYKEKKWAFVSDWARLKILYNYGGIYLDTDVELIKPIDDLLFHSCFAGFEGSLSKEQYVATGLIFGAEKGHVLLRELLETYKGISFYKSNAEMNLLACTAITTTTIERAYNVELDGNYKELPDGIVLYPAEFFCPKNYETGKISISDNTYSIHHYGNSWFSKKQKFFLFMKRLVGKRIIHLYYILKTNGIKGAIFKLISMKGR